MKKLIHIGLLLIGMVLQAQAQTQAYSDLAATTPASPANNEAVSVANQSRIHYVVKAYGGIPTPKATFEEEHFLGNDLSAKWNAFNQNFTHVYSVSIGPSTSNTEIVKPAIYNAVNKVNNYYKKAIRKGLVSKDEAVKQLSHIFDCANVMCFDDESAPFEQAVNKAGSPEEIIALFQSVEIKII